MAQKLLGDCYLLGRGTNEDLKLAKEWYEKSSKQGYEEATEILKIMGHGTNEDFKLTKEWVKKKWLLPNEIYTKFLEILKQKCNNWIEIKKKKTNDFFY